MHDRLAILPLLGFSLVIGAAETAPLDPTQTILDTLRTANRARAELAREETAWTAERQRLEAALAGIEADRLRLEGAATEAESALADIRRQSAALNTAAGADRLSRVLDDCGHRLGAALTTLAGRLPPGVLPPHEDLRSFAAAVQALDEAERAAATVGVEVAVGQRDGQREAAKVLRVAGAVAWWIALDGRSAGRARREGGTLVFQADADAVAREAIAAAVAQAEGRAQPGIVLLPGGAP